MARALTSKAEEQGFTFSSPIDGDMLNAMNDGTLVNGHLLTTIKIKAASSSVIQVNGIDAKYVDGLFLTDVLLKDYKNVIEAVERNSGQKQSITIFWLKNFTGKYRLSLDDNIWFLKDLAVNSEKYKSIFENPYLNFLKQVNDTYGTKIHINIFYQTEGFNLSQLTTQYKNEWIANAKWLRLSFHALQEMPDRPYLKASYDEVKRDCEKVINEIHRFAGTELTGSVTTLHWGEAKVEGSRALRDEGYTTQVGYFNVDNDDSPVSYYLNVEQRRHLTNRSIWRDNKEGITFVRIAQVINLFKVEQIIPLLDDIKKNPRRSEFIELMIHEQYFYPSYEAYQPDYREKVLTAVKWAVDNGYQPAFLEECVI
ncbi:MAG: hypothetical protein JJE09_05710 [Bacteroidia bacterium]|nr:hypothetical protein [Bacteroidia bacterium]